MLRRLAFVRAAQQVGLSPDEVRSALATLPAVAVFGMRGMLATDPAPLCGRCCSPAR